MFKMFAGEIMQEKKMGQTHILALQKEQLMITRRKENTEKKNR